MLMCRAASRVRARKPLVVSGTSVPTDYVELPSQILERWLPTPEVLGRFAKHYRTGESMPQALVKRPA